MFKKKKSGGDPAPMQELTVMKGSNVLLGGGGGGDEESPAKRPLTELEKIQREKDALETELKALRKLVDEKALDDIQKTEADSLRDSVTTEVKDDLSSLPSDDGSLTGSGGFNPFASIRHRINRQTAKQFSSRRYKKNLGEKFESFDYDAPDDVSQYHSLKDKKEVQKLEAKKEFFRGLYVVLIGAITGVIAYWMTFAVGRMVTVKWDKTWELLQAGKTMDSYLYYISWTVGCLFLAGLLVVWAPESAGSGIPQVKAYLNGNQVPGILRFKTLIAKVLGITLCVTSGMPAGREGPMVHTGSILAAGLARGYSDYFAWLPNIYTGFDNTRDRRDFVSMGAAAGVAAAFNAPIGGILFSLEEVSSFWSPELTWRTFICAIIAAYTVNIFMASFNGNFNDSGLVLFGHTTEDGGTYETWEIFAFIIVAVLGGLIGAAYVTINEKITVLRKRFWAGMHPAWRIFEAIIYISFLLSLFFWLPMLWECKYDDVTHNGDASHHTGFHGLHPIQYNCADSHYYNELATLLLTPQETTILQLYSRNTHGYFSIFTLAIFTVLFFFSAVTAYGIAVPAGLFIPGMMVGAGMGRLVGELLYTMFGDKIDPGLYALVGASAVLGGITRMTISLTVIMVEISNDINYLLPIMLALAISKAVGDKFTHSLYDVHMDLASIPYLEADPPDVFNSLSAESIMSRKVVMIGVDASVAEIEDALDTHHNAFPVVDKGVSSMNRFFVGLITRENLDGQLQKCRSTGRASIDVSLAMDPSPFIAQSQLSLRRVLRLFRGMGLRHVVVVDSRQRVVGIITRKDFINAPTTVQMAVKDPRFVRATREAMMRMERSTRIKGANANAPVKLKRSNSFVGVL